MKKKYEKKLEAILSNEEMARIEKVENEFPKKKNSDAINILWAMVIRNEYFSENMKQLDIADLPEDAYLIVTRVLKNAWREANGELVDCDETKEANFELERKIQSISGEEIDWQVVFAYVYRKCKYAVTEYSKENVDRLIFLLSSQKKQFEHGGLRDMSFSKEEAILLQPAAGEIAQVLVNLVSDEITDGQPSQLLETTSDNKVNDIEERKNDIIEKQQKPIEIPLVASPFVEIFNNLAKALSDIYGLDPRQLLESKE